MQNYSIEDISSIIISHYEAPPLAHVHTFGCQQNVNDGEKIKGVLSALGFGLTDIKEEADFILFNTCAIREHAELRVFGNIGTLKKLKEQNPKLMIGLCGCMVQQQHIVEKIKKSYPYVDIVFGVNAIDQLPELLYQKLTGVSKLLLDPVEKYEINEQIPIFRDSTFKAWLPIMYGCDNYCSYCIVPYVRGRERSRAPEDILMEFKELIEQGYKEVTLLGQNVNSYGKGLAVDCDFSDLLELLCTVPGDYRIRFMTSHPKDATHKLIDTIAAHEQICNHIHLPVQSGSDNILQRMNRKYTVESYLELLSYAKQKIEGVTFSSDVIVGFPGETEEEFFETVNLVKQVGYIQLFTFIYSKRKGTKAAEFLDETPRKTKADRLNFLSKEQERFTVSALKKFIGTSYRVLVEGAGRGEGSYSGRLSNNLVVEFQSDKNLTGTFANVIITGSKKAVLSGKLL